MQFYEAVSAADKNEEVRVILVRAEGNYYNINFFDSIVSLYVLLFGYSWLLINIDILNSVWYTGRMFTAGLDLKRLATGGLAGGASESRHGQSSALREVLADYRLPIGFLFSTTAARISFVRFYCRPVCFAHAQWY
tara:strand:+ start:311 stop:718 length:408 start_codon:yes stop_codon:yes gene_type:complete